ncbi:MAG TPA: dTDP-4-dehydrorhamnose 3,5-epimerase family protein [Thermoanaerobaculaceae bacterium]|nr:dTDP-4-dehydrorhamnose 3,5-epimerase family protein [Thermoanaerobaculaceae bacterium]HRS17691.1 dTDP-4-dehydrorhamnose 3,5-epimerase family protein [Thermoanaerobaculaceae bacterium]
MTLGPHDILEGFEVAPKSYDRPQPIAGVEILPLQRFVDDRGLFIELFRSGATHPGTEKLAAFFEAVPPAQVNFSLVTASDHVKGLHYHLAQTDVWFCPPPSKMKVVLLDIRRGSPTSGRAQVVVLGEGRDALVKIPPGVAHGYRPLTLPCGLFYFVTRCFDLAAPDEYRVAWDHPLVRDLWPTRNE